MKESSTKNKWIKERGGRRGGKGERIKHLNWGKVAKKAVAHLHKRKFTARKKKPFDHRTKAVLIDDYRTQRTAGLDAIEDK